jgi:hypothetical protein
MEVDIKAWPESKETGKQGDCPLFGKEPLDATRSRSGDGRFELKVDAARRTYTTTYCSHGVFPRADPDLGNLSDGASVVPTPVELYARGNDSAVYERIVEQKVIGLLNDLAYLQTINADGFSATVNKLSATLEPRDSQRARVLRDVDSLVRGWKR